MGRFARGSETAVRNRNPAKMMPRPSPKFTGQARFEKPKRRTWEEPNQPNSHAPAELKYFVLALAALVGLGLGWLLGKAIIGGLPAASPAQAVAERAAPPLPEAAVDGSQAAPSESKSEATPTPEAVPGDAARQDVSPSPGTVAQAALDESLARSERRIARRAIVRRQARGNYFFRPFRALRRLRLW